MDVVIVRHGEACQAPIQQDESRTLTERGRGDIHKLGQALSRLLAGEMKIVASPLARTRETAQILAEELHLAAPEERRELKPGARPTWLLNFLSDAPAREVMIIVGHAPDVCDMVETFTGDPEVDVRFSPGTAAVIHFDEGPPKRGLGEITHCLNAGG